ncbi:hypothetical protein GTY78_06465 [Streptomyces sp. SID4934]|nr:hypothetical protein [Streptomyces sp. SID4934]
MPNTATPRSAACTSRSWCLHPIAAPVAVAERLRKGSAGSAKGAATLIAEAIKVVRAMGATGVVVVRADLAFFSHKVVAACRRHKASFSLAVAQCKRVRELIAAIPETAWTPIKYPKAIWDKDEERWISDAEVAEVECTAFTGKAKKYRATARLLVRRVRRLNYAHVPDTQGDCSRSGASTRCSPTAPTRWSKRSAATARTPYWSRSSPICRTPYWAIGHRGSSPRTPPGSPWLCSPTISPAPWARSPRHSMPRPARAPSAANSSPSQYGWPPEPTR